MALETEGETPLRTAALARAPAHLVQLRRTLACAERAIAGPDPEAVYGYLEVLADQALAASADHR